jgi:hypothetical protein
MNPGKKAAGGVLGYVFYGVAAVATAGTGTFMYRHWTRLEQEPARAAVTSPATSPVAIEETELPPDHPLRLANEKVKKDLDSLANFKSRVNPKETAAPAPKSASAGPGVPANTKGHITMIGKAGKMTAVAPASDADRNARTFEEAYQPATPTYTGAGGGGGADGPQFFTTKDPMEAVRKRDADESERRRQAEKNQYDPKFQSRSTETYR